MAEARDPIRAGRTADAVPILRQLVEAAPEAASAWYLLGYALHAEGDLERALAAHARAASVLTGTPR